MVQCALTGAALMWRMAERSAAERGAPAPGSNAPSPAASPPRQREPPPAPELFAAAAGGGGDGDDGGPPPPFDDSGCGPAEGGAGPDWGWGLLGFDGGDDSDWPAVDNQY